jgi:hypothetical protein
VKARVLAPAAAALLSVAYLTRGAGGGAPPVVKPTASPLLGALPTSAPLQRDPFRFGRDRTPAAPQTGPLRATPPRLPAPVAPLPASAPALRLIGYVRVAGRLRAALAISGEIVLAGLGDNDGAYTVIGLDEDTGVTLRGPDGVESTLTAPP